MCLICDPSLVHMTQASGCKPSRIRERHLEMYLHWKKKNGIEMGERTSTGHTRWDGLTGGPFWHFSSLPISLYYINEVISCDIAAQSHVGVVDLVL